MESSAGQSPNRVIQIKLNNDASVGTKFVEKCFCSSWRGDQFGKYRRAQYQGTVFQSIVKGLLSGIANSRVAVPKGNDHIGIDRGRHRSRMARVQRMIAFFPEPIPRLPIPRYLANGLFVLTGRTLTPVLSSSKSNTSPARTPRALRMARGTVICPLDVIFACFSKP